MGRAEAGEKTMISFTVFPASLKAAPWGPAFLGRRYSHCAIKMSRTLRDPSPLLMPIPAFLPTLHLCACRSNVALLLPEKESGCDWDSVHGQPSTCCPCDGRGQSSAPRSSSPCPSGPASPLVDSLPKTALEKACHPLRFALRS